MCAEWVRQRGEEGQTGKIVNDTGGDQFGTGVNREECDCFFRRG